MPRHALISSLKDEGPFILEWVAHHHVLGFDAIHVASNDCNDGSDHLLDALAAEGLLTHTPNRLAPGDIPQHSGYAKIRAAGHLDGCEWLMMLDTDEFLNVHAGSHLVSDLTALAGDADIIRISGRVFSDLPETTWRPGPVTQLFPMALARRHQSNGAIKTLTRWPARFSSIHNHHLVGCREDGDLTVYCAQNGRVISIPAKGPFASSLRHIAVEDIGFAVAQYNHYAIKTLDSFLLRRRRGRGAAAQTGVGNDRHTHEYFSKRAGRGHPEPSIQRYRARTEALMQDWLTHPRINAAHRQCLDAYARSIARLSEQDPKA